MKQYYNDDFVHLLIQMYWFIHRVYVFRSLLTFFTGRSKCAVFYVIANWFFCFLSLSLSSFQRHTYMANIATLIHARFNCLWIRQTKENNNNNIAHTHTPWEWIFSSILLSIKKTMISDMVFFFSIVPGFPSSTHSCERFKIWMNENLKKKKNLINNDNTSSQRLVVTKKKLKSSHVPMRPFIVFF